VEVSFVKDVQTQFDVIHNIPVSLDCTVNYTSDEIKVKWKKDGLDLKCSSRYFNVFGEYLPTIH